MGRGIDGGSVKDCQKEKVMPLSSSLSSRGTLLVSEV